MSLLRTFLTSFGIFLLGKNLFGSVIDQSIWQMVVGVTMAGVSVIWGIFDKTVGIEEKIYLRVLKKKDYTLDHFKKDMADETLAHF